MQNIVTISAVAAVCDRRIVASISDRRRRSETAATEKERRYISHDWVTNTAYITGLPPGRCRCRESTRQELQQQVIHPKGARRVALRGKVLQPTAI